jgi:hypothetical protein
MDGDNREVEERAYAPPPRFDVTIGYWTGEPEEGALTAAMERIAREAPEVTAARCPLGHLHVRGPRAAVAAAEAAILPADQFSRLETCGGCR